MESKASLLNLLNLFLRASEDVVKSRQRARQISQLLGFDLPAQTRNATIVSEIARNAYRYAGAGKVIFSINHSITASYFSIHITDNGPGINDLDKILANSKAKQATGQGNRAHVR